MSGAATSKGATSAAVSNAIVGIYSKHYGKGPTRAKTYLLDDVIVTVLQDIFTTVERTLIDAGKGETVRDVRTTFQYAMRDEFIEAVATATGRRPRGFLSQVEWHTDTAIEVFMLGDGESASVSEITDGDVPEITDSDGAAT
jgi:uncharacterized protein YbcI